MGTLNKTTADIQKALSPSRISIYLPSPHAQVLTDAATWYKLTAPMSNGEAVDFTLRGTPDFDILFSGMDSSCILVIGDADLSLSGAGATIEFGLFINDVEAAKFTSKALIAADTDIQGFGTNGTVDIDSNDEIDIRAKCDGAGHTVTIQNMKVTFLLVEV